MRTVIVFLLTLQMLFILTVGVHLRSKTFTGTSLSEGTYLVRNYQTGACVAESDQSQEGYQGKNL